MIRLGLVLEGHGQSGCHGVGPNSANSVCVFPEENKEEPLCNRKSHLMKLRDALGPITLWATGCSISRKRAFPFSL